MLTHCAVAKLKQTATIFKYCCDTSERYLYTSLEDWNRDSTYSGHAYTITDNWYPGLVSALSPIPIGQNKLYFFYETTPTVRYWMFAVVWAIISIGLFTAGAVVYNKYDVK